MNIDINEDLGIPSKEPPGCEPQSHWEARCLVMEYVIQELIIAVGVATPAIRDQLLVLIKDWTAQRDKIREAFRTDR